MDAVRVIPHRSGDDALLGVERLADGPDEAEQFAGDGDEGLLGALPATHQAPVAPVEAVLVMRPRHWRAPVEYSEGTTPA